MACFVFAIVDFGRFAGEYCFVQGAHSSYFAATSGASQAGQTFSSDASAAASSVAAGATVGS